MISPKYCAIPYGSTEVRLGLSRSERVTMPQAPKEYHLVDLLTGESLGGFVTLAAAREEARAAGLTSWDIFQGNVRIERHDPGVDDPVGIPKEAANSPGPTNRRSVGAAGSLIGRARV